MHGRGGGRGQWIVTTAPWMEPLTIEAHVVTQQDMSDVRESFEFALGGHLRRQTHLQGRRGEGGGGGHCQSRSKFDSPSWKEKALSLIQEGIGKANPLAWQEGGRGGGSLSNYSKLTRPSSTSQAKPHCTCPQQNKVKKNPTVML